MPWIKRHREIGTATLSISGIDRRILAFSKMCAHRRDQVPTGGKPYNAYLMRINVPLSGIEACQADRALRIL